MHIIKGCCPRHLLAAVLTVALAIVLGGFMVIANAQGETPTAPGTPMPEGTPATPPAQATSSPVPGQPSDNPTTDLSIGILDWTLGQWIDVGISLLIFLAIASFGGRVLIWLGRQIARRTHTAIDDRIISSLSRPLQWLGTIIGFQIAYLRLDFITAGWRELFDNVSFVLYVVVVSVIIWQLINYALSYYRERAQAQDANMKSIDRLLPLVRTFAKGLLVIVAFIIILHHFGIEITAAVAALGITGFALSLAAKDTLTNMISGFIIAVDQPFRIGDRIYSESVKGWVDVVEIGIRSTHVHTRDNRMVVIPNSLLSDAAVINYNYPNRNYRLQVDLDIAYGTEFDKLHQVLHDAVRNVKGVMLDKPVQVLFVGFGESAMIFRVRWWIADFANMRAMNDRVYQAIQEALDAHDIVSPNPAYDVSYHLGQEEAERLAQLFRNGSIRDS